RVLHRPENPRGHLLLVHPEAAVYRGDDEVEGGAQLGRVIEAAVLQDVGLDALEDPDPGELAIDFVDLRVLALHVFRAQAAGVGRTLAVIGDSHVGEAGLAPGLRPAPNGAGTV